MSARRPLLDEQGIALPLALIALVVLTSLMLAFALLSGSEPLIADNQLRSARARALAESGVERAIWGLSTGAIPEAPATAVAPYDGSLFFALGAPGGFTVAVTSATPPDDDARDVEATGWSPAQTDAAAARKIRTTVIRVRLPDPPCGICSLGPLTVTGNSSVDARTGGCTGDRPFAPTAGTITSGATSVSGSGDVFGPDGNNTPDQRPGDVLDGVDPSQFDFLLDLNDIQALKELAKQSGNYYKGSVTFNSSNPLPNGVVFIDTTTGADFTSSTPDAEAGRAVIDGNITWKGWLVVEGSVEIRGTVNLTGLVYALNELKLTGNGTLTGSVVSENRKGSTGSEISTATGSSAVTYNCQAVRDGGGQVPSGWFVKTGTFREIEGR